jgi:hypothetical protein
LIQSFLDPQESDTKLRKKWHTDPTTGVLGKYCQVGFTYILEKSFTGFTFDGQQEMREIQVGSMTTFH